MSERDYCAIAADYAAAVISGTQVACQWVRRACERQVKDLAREGWRWHFDEARAARVCLFIECLPHIKGPLAGYRITLEPWQVFILTAVFGWVDDDGYRRFRRVYIEVPRGNGKSALSSGVSLYMLCADGEGGAEVYSLATTRDQARIVFGDAQHMVRRSPGLRARFGVDLNAHNIHVLETASKFEALSAEGSTLDGLNIHFGCIDELHAHKTRAVYDVVETGMGKRMQSMLWVITTAGTNRAGICYEARSFVTKILDGVIEDDTQFGIIYGLDESDDWSSEAALAKANPNWGISVMPDVVRPLQAKARTLPSATNNFLTKHLNVWCNAGSAWMDMRAWEACADHSLDIMDFQGCKAWIGVDLAEKRDIAALCILFERGGEYYAFFRLYLHDEGIEESGNSQFSGWERAGHLIGNPGNITDLDVLANEMRECCALFDVQEIPYDPALSRYFATKLIEEGLPMVEIRQASVFFTQPLIQIENLVLEKKFHFDGNPMVSWMVSNVVTQVSKFTGLRHPTKDRPENKIDGVLALLMALGRAMAGVEAEPDLSEFLANPIVIG